MPRFILENRYTTADYVRVEAPTAEAVWAFHLREHPRLHRRATKTWNDEINVKPTNVSGEADFELDLTGREVGEEEGLIKRRFDTLEEAEAFIEGVALACGSALELVTPPAVTTSAMGCDYFDVVFRDHQER